MPASDPERQEAVPTPAPTGVSDRTSMRRRITIFGLQIDALTMDETIAAVDGLIAAGGVHQHVVVNVAKVVQAERDPELKAIINSCDLVNADGQPIVWAARLLGKRLPQRVTGIDLMTRLFARAEVAGYSVYLLGARKQVVERVVRRLERQHPRLTIAGWRDGYWQPEDEEAVVDAIAVSHPTILFLAIPSPAKERFLARWKDRVGAAFTMGVGGSFDVYSGTVRRAPVWLQRAGLEWLFRTAQEPRRMLRRYVNDGFRFVVLLLRAVSGRRL